MLFNPHAVLCYSPSRYSANVPNTGSGHSPSVTATRLQTSGQYIIHLGGQPALDAALASLGLTPRGSNGRSVTLERDDVCRVLHALGGHVTASYSDASTEFCAFQQAQVDAIGSGSPDPVFVQGQREFEQQADLLLKRVQQELHPKFKIRNGTNPLWARSLASRRDGVFLWPDWQDQRYVNVVLGCSDDNRPRLRDMVLDWSESTRLRINPRFSF
jgi:hypothetical protein